METDLIVCASCLHENDEGIQFCRNCGAPIGDYTTTMPIERIQAQGFAYRQATSSPGKPIVLGGMYVIFGSMLIGTTALAVHATIHHSISGVVLGLLLGAIPSKILMKTTRKYIENRKAQRRQSEAE